MRDDRERSAAAAGPLRQRWDDLVERLDGVPTHTDEVLDLLLRCYGEPHRHYHTLEHVLDVLAHVDALVEAGEEVGDREAVELAAWFHDAIQAPGADDDEARSAELAAEVLTRGGLAPARVAHVVELVLCTADHRPDGADAAILCDADLAVLGRPWADYLRYARQIRAEYRTVPDEAYRAGRARVLRGLLERSNPYTTPTMRRRRGARLRANLAEEIRRLGDAGRPVDEALRHAAG